MAVTDSPFHIVSNAGSGSKDAHEARQQIETILSEAGRPHEFILIENPEQLADVAKKAVNAAAESGGAVVVAGGDGTINAVVQAVLPTRRPFGIIPQGTFNYSSRAHGIPLDTSEATRSLLTARIKPVQVGMVNNRAFLVNASLGLYPQLLQDREEYKRQYGRRRSVAMYSGLVTLLHEHRKWVVDVEHEHGRETLRTPTIFVGNNALQLEQIGLEEAEDVKRNRSLAALIVEPVSTGKLLWLAVRGMLGNLGEDEHVRNFPFRSMTVRLLSGVGPKGIKVAVDGEIFWCQPPLNFEVAPHPLMLLAPAAGPEK
ncbi:diacylglycerol/lipid kinase family protein [Steroidobacter sp.]|uniref:diacylglycerol/lipid kinase family protein n=1 Tax=Steroidobacter sp. TaxID=1978227 RepID=UPI001A5CAB4C|nr:diacylglycerol kinase family protein [Steroidobacter sp.]MBL8271128.1 NAD(+)/NADH kinase [Steroidobacter sp.]